MMAARSGRTPIPPSARITTSGSVTSTSGQSCRTASRTSARVSIRRRSIDRESTRAYTCASQKTTPVTSTVNPMIPASEESYSRETAITDVARMRP